MISPDTREVPWGWKLSGSLAPKTLGGYHRQVGCVGCVGPSGCPASVGRGKVLL